MNRKKRLLPITFEINKDYSTSDGRFLDVIIDVLHTGLNLNDTIFEKEIVGLKSLIIKLSNIHLHYNCF